MEASAEPVAEVGDRDEQGDGCGDENEKLQWQGWLVERHEMNLEE